MNESRGKSAAMLTIRNASEMTPKVRREIANWLEKQARLLLEHPKELSARYTARYLYR